MARSRDYDDDDDYDDDYDDRPRRRGGSPPPNYLVPAILVTLFCCWPFGIPAIVFAAQVNTKWAEGDSRGAREASAKAKMWCWWSAGGWMALVAVYIVFAIVMVAAGAN